jgi:hypothetical protein
MQSRERHPEAGSHGGFAWLKSSVNTELSEREAAGNGAVLNSATSMQGPARTQK